MYSVSWVESTQNGGNTLASNIPVIFVPPHVFILGGLFDIVVTEQIAQLIQSNLACRSSVSANIFLSFTGNLYNPKDERKYLQQTCRMIVLTVPILVL